jgi:hypothetical protein
MPSIWKLANIIPIPQPGKDNSEPSNYWQTKTGVNCITPIFFYLKFNLVFFLFTFFIKRSKESGTTASK